MIEFILNSLFIFGIRALLKPGMLFHFLVKRWYSNDYGPSPFDGTENYHFNGPEWHKMIYVCAPCMASTWGTLGYLVFLNVHSINENWYILVGTWIIWVISLAGLNYIISNLMNK